MEKRKRGNMKSRVCASADACAAVAVLQGLHENYSAEPEPIEVWKDRKHGYVTATRKTNVGEIMLAPCIPKQAKVHTCSEHPYVVEVKFKVWRAADASS